MSYRLEPMAEPHRKQVVDLYNHYVETSFAAYPETSAPYALFDRFLAITRGYPALVATSERTGEVVGFAFLHPYHPATSFNRTAEITYFLSPAHTRQGLGTLFLQSLEEAARPLGVDCLLANVSSRNEASLEFHRKQGFVECGRFREIGRKRGEDFDIVWFQKRL
jgi:phosphinothricin acetyltransferase